MYCSFTTELQAENYFVSIASRKKIGDQISSLGRQILPFLLGCLSN